METTSISEQLEALKCDAFDLGFGGFGVARPEMVAEVARFQQWLDNNFEGEMAYMGRGLEKREDPNRVLPGVQSVISVWTNYLTAEKPMSYLDDVTTGDISLYALNRDYHDFILEKLKKLEQSVQIMFPECHTKIYVDTGPVLEKPLAQKAGLGWVGKHTNLISEGVGSWYFLSEILVDVELPVSVEAVDRCGTCQRCIDICPTDAIIAPYTLDSRKCISYLTIELKGPIPLEFRKAIGNRIFGCDDCQIVCPWNSFAVKCDEPAFEEQPGSRLLIDLIGLDDDSFRARFKNSPIKRIKRRGFLRNVAIALGNSADPAAVPPLVKVLDDKEPLIRAHAVWALGELLGQQAVKIIQDEMPNESDPLVLLEIQGIRERGSSTMASD